MRGTENIFCKSQRMWLFRTSEGNGRKYNSIRMRYIDTRYRTMEAHAISNDGTLTSATFISVDIVAVTSLIRNYVFLFK